MKHPQKKLHCLIPILLVALLPFIDARSRYSREELEFQEFLVRMEKEELLLQLKSEREAYFTQLQKKDFLKRPVSEPYTLDQIMFELALPEDRMNITQVIEFYNYTAENHEVVTEDGYILNIQRIRCPRGMRTCSTSPPVLLQHGLIDSAHTWVDNLPHQSLGFILADKGFDVWLSNSRGNTYSKSHQHLNPKDREFWDFSWDDMAQYDLPAIINYIVKTTNYPTLGYAGHSQGTEIAFARFNENDEVTRRINSFVALAPVVYLGNVQTILRTLAKHPEVLQFFLSIVGHGEFLPSTELMIWLSEFFCSQPGIAPLCTNFIFYLTGFDISNMNQTRLPVYMSHTPAGTSLNNMMHYCQSINTNNFQRYDFGEEKNMAKYGQSTPPFYSVANISVPIAVFSGGNDSLATPSDVQNLMKILPSVKMHKVLAYYNHMDFVWGMDAERAIYPDVVKFFKDHASQP